MQNIANVIDHSILRPDAVDADMVKLCDEAARYGFHSVCVHPSFIARASELLFQTHVKICTVVGFPLGASLPRVKMYEAMEAATLGADELDVVMNIGAAKSGDWHAVEKEISDIISATPAVLHKIIIETCYLTDDEKKRASLVSVNAGAAFVKTSTGFGPAGAVIDDVRLIRETTGGKTGIKAAGGISSLDEVLSFIKAGATRIGTSSGVRIMEEYAACSG